MHLSVRIGATSLEKETFGVVCARPTHAMHSTRGHARLRCCRLFAGFHTCPSLDPDWRPLYQKVDLAVNGTVRLLLDAATSVWYEDRVRSMGNPGRNQKESSNEVPDPVGNTLDLSGGLPGDHGEWGGRCYLRGPRKSGCRDRQGRFSGHGAGSHGHGKPPRQA